MNYSEVGAIAQAIKYQIRTGGLWDELNGLAKESLDQIATAIARTVSGDGAHWDAIISYAQVAKPGEPDPMRSQVEVKRPGHLFDPPEPRAQRAGMEAIERSMREIPTRNSDG